MAAEIERQYQRLSADVQFQQTKLTEQWSNAKEKLKGLERDVKWRKLVAIIFRGVFVLGGFAISLGLPGYWPRIVGAMVTLVGLIDNQWLFNHEILMFNTPARNAFRKLLETIANDFTEAFSPMPENPEKSAEANERLNGLLVNIKQAKKALFNGSQRITDALENKELGVLKKLATQPETTAPPVVKTEP
jgi:hypothetical protein